MQNIRCRVKDAADPVSTKVPHGRKAKRDNVLLHNASQFLVISARLNKLTSFDPAVVCGLQEFLALFINVANDKHFTAITMIAIQIHRDIDIHNIPVLQYSIIWNSVTYDLVHTRTATLGKAVVVERRWVGTRRQNGIVNNRIDFIRRDARFDRPPRQIENLSCQFARGSHLFNLFGFLDLDHPGQKRHVASLLGTAVEGIIGKVKVTRYDDFLGRLLSGSDASGVRKLVDGSLGRNGGSKALAGGRTRLFLFFVATLAHEENYRISVIIGWRKHCWENQSRSRWLKGRRQRQHQA
mmetsp:Transcript_2424/g.5130  ORF Transcript_2424/g.5130 Transcript_2424/m.5130 type:complete len:296 (+) Transcript_2424:452-1339(+)